MGLDGECRWFLMFSNLLEKGGHISYHNYGGTSKFYSTVCFGSTSQHFMSLKKVTHLNTRILGTGLAALTESFGWAEASECASPEFEFGPGERNFERKLSDAKSVPF